MLLLLWVENREERTGLKATRRLEQGDPMSPFPRKTGWEPSALSQGRFSSPTGEFLCPEALFEQGMRTLGWPSTENHKRH